jgi:hypothetical protein
VGVAIPAFDWWVLRLITDVIAMCSVIAHPGKQQIPPLRCAAVGMTDLYQWL